MKRTAALAAALTLSACSGLSNIFDSGNPGGCASCSSTQVCHPVTNECVDTCTSASMCSSAALSCSDLAGTTSKVCTCTADGNCGLTEICQPWGQCDDKCTSSSACPSTYTCDTASGKCTKPSGGDGGTDGGTTCTSGNQQPDTCGYGNVCQTSGSCQAAQKGTCSNFPAAHSTSGWTPANGTGYVIWTHVDESPDEGCSGATDTGYTVTLRAYTTTGTFPPNETNLPGFKYVTTSGNEIDIPVSLLLQSNYSVSTDMKAASMKFTLCSSSSTGIQAGFYFTGGNPYCANLTHQ
ncbi:MAG: hypothetical protein JNK82_12175 [Myxococcaceae bacterium]|nr:hypothetical protein [Myxococcaceae bacterium]